MVVSIDPYTAELPEVARFFKGYLDSLYPVIPSGGEVKIRAWDSISYVTNPQGINKTIIQSMDGTFDPSQGSPFTSYGDAAYKKFRTMFFGTLLVEGFFTGGLNDRMQVIIDKGWIGNSNLPGIAQISMMDIESNPLKTRFMYPGGNVYQATATVLQFGAIYEGLFGAIESVTNAGNVLNLQISFNGIRIDF